MLNLTSPPRLRLPRRPDVASRFAPPLPSPDDELPLATAGAARDALVVASLLERSALHVALTARAARRLDAAEPGWRAAVDPAALRLTDPRLCVLGQVFGARVLPYAGYELGMTRLYGADAARRVVASRATGDFPPLPADALAFAGWVPEEPWLAELRRAA